MVKETTLICIDTSDYMGQHDSPKYLAQLDALELYLQLIIKPHSDHYVGVYGLAGYSRCCIVEPTNTNDMSDIMTIVRRSQICMQSHNINIDRVLSEIMREHADVLTRMVLFIGGPLLDFHYDPNIYRRGKYSSHRFTMPLYTCLGRRIKERGVALDIIHFGIQQQGFKKHTLCVILAAADNNGNARMLDRSGYDDLDASSLLALVGNGRTGLESVLLMQGDDFQTFINQYKIDFDKEKQDDEVPDEGGEICGDRGVMYDQKQDDQDPDEGWEICEDQGDMYDQKQDDQDPDEGWEICGDQGDMYDQKQDDKGPDEVGEICGDGGDRYDQKQDDKGPDEVGEICGDQGDRHGQNQDDTTSRCFRIRLSVDTSSNSIGEESGHDEEMKHGRRQDDNMLRVGKDIGIEVMGTTENKIIEIMTKDVKHIGIELVGMAPVMPASSASDGSYYYPPNVAPVSHMQMGTSFDPYQPVYGPQATPYQSQQPYFQSNIPQYGQQMHPGQPEQMIYMPTYPPMGTSFAPHQPDIYGPEATSYQSQQPYFQSNIPQYGQQMHLGQPQQTMYMPPTYSPTQYGQQMHLGQPQQMMYMRTYPLMGTSFAPHQPDIYGPEATSYQPQSNIPQYGQQMHLGQPQQMMYMPTYPPEMPYNGRDYY